MSSTQAIIPVSSDVDQFLSTEKSMLDTDIVDLFKQFNIASLLRGVDIKKRAGHAPIKLLFDLFLIPFLMISTVHLFVRNQIEAAAGDTGSGQTKSKNAYYRFLENPNFDWSRFQRNVSFKVYQAIKDEQPEKKKGEEEFYVIDDTVVEVSGKLIELVSYIYDHVQNKSVLGFCKLALGIFNGQQIIPISERMKVGKKKPQAKSKATKYKKTAKSEQIDPASPGAVARKEADKTKLKLAENMLKQAIKKGFTAKTVLFDSWFAFNCFIIAICALDLDVICQLKNLPKANKYIYKGKTYSLKELYNLQAKPKMRMVKKYQFKQAVLTVDLPNSDVKMRIVFVQNEGQDKWHAFGATNTKLSAKKILASYAKRWSIEVFFKNCKQYLNYGKEQVSNFDSIVASDAIVYLRYTLLTYLAFKNKTSFYENVHLIRKDQLAHCFGIQLLKFFMNQLKALIQYVVNLIQNDQKEKAMEALKTIEKFNPKLVEIGGI